MGADDNLVEIRRIYQAIDDHFDALYAQCNATQKTQLTALRDSARDAFWRAISANLADDHGLVVQTFNELQVTNNQLDTDLKSLQDISGCLQTLTEGVKLAAALVTLASVA
jgi:hypothetical protein